MSLLDEYSKDIEKGVATPEGGEVATPSPTEDGTWGNVKDTGDKDGGGGTVGEIAGGIIDASMNMGHINTHNVNAEYKEGNKQSQTIGTDSSVSKTEFDPVIYAQTMNELEGGIPHPTYDSIRASLGIPQNRPNDEEDLKRLRRASIFKNIGNGLQLIAEGAGLMNGSSVEKQDIKNTSYDEFRKRMDKYKDDKDKLDMMINAHLLQAEQARRQQMHALAANAATTTIANKQHMSGTNERSNTSGISGGYGEKPVSNRNGSANNNIYKATASFLKNTETKEVGSANVTFKDGKGAPKDVYTQIATLFMSEKDEVPSQIKANREHLQNIGLDVSFFKDVAKITDASAAAGKICVLAGECLTIIQKYRVDSKEFKSAKWILNRIESLNVDITIK